MFEVVFGIIWTIFTAFFTWGFYGTNGNVTVNGHLVSHEEFSDMLWPKIFISIFWIAGLFILLRGLKKVIRNVSTDAKGEVCFGKICDVYNSGTYVNGRPELKADVLVYIPSIQETKIISEIIGFDRYKYRNGPYVRLKYYNGDINFEEVIDSTDLPLDAQNELVKSQSYNTNLKDTIVVDGIEYVRKDSIEFSGIRRDSKNYNE